MLGLLRVTIHQELRARLGRDVFQPATSRLLWVPFYLSIIAFCVVLTLKILSGWGTMWAIPLLTVTLGLAYGGLAYVAHETLHGGITRTRWLRSVIGWIGFAPVLVSPTLWVAWHNRIHHRNANVVGVDPDAYPTMDQYKTELGTRLMVDLGSPRKGQRAGIFAFVIGFTIQSLHMLVVAKKRGYLKASLQFRGYCEATVAIALALSVGFFFGWLAFVVIYFIPMLIANVMVMASILTNHSLSSLADEDDPLMTCLSLTVPRWFRIYTLGFCYHVEHHFFPTMSHRFAPQVHDVIMQLYPERYRCIPIGQALRLLFSTPRVYQSHDVLVDPANGETWEAFSSSRAQRTANSDDPTTSQIEGDTRSSSENTDLEESI